MKQLVLKDIRLVGLINILLLVLALGLGYTGVSYGGMFQAHAVYMTSILIGTYLVLMTLTNKDTQYNAEPLIISMPVKKFNIVVSRYITLFYYMIFLIGTIFLSSNVSKLIFNDVDGYTFKLVPMAFTLSLLLVFLSINIPLQYYDRRKTQIFNALLYAFIILAPNIYTKLGLSFLNPELLEKIMDLNFKILTPIVVLISLSLYIVSMFVSKFIYERKEF